MRDPLEPDISWQRKDEYRLRRVWNTDKGDWEYWLDQHSYVVVTTRFNYYSNVGRTGDRAWAERQAEHLGIEIEE